MNLNFFKQTLEGIGRHVMAIAMLAWFSSLGHTAESWTFERAISHALANSPDARIAQLRIAAAQAGVEQANSALWPHLQLQSSYSHTDNPMLAFGSILNQRSYRSSLDFNKVPDLDDLNVRGVLTMPLYTGGRITAERKVARANATVAKASAEAVRNNLALEVAETFHTVLKTREFIRAAEASVRSFENNLATASNRVELGAALKTDRLDMQVRLAQAREDLVRTQNAHALSVSALRNLLGIENEEFTVADVSPAVAAPEPRDSSQRPEFAVVRHRQRAAEAQLRLAKATYQPRVSAFGSVDYDYGWRTDGDGKSYNAGVMLQWDLWDGKRTRGRASEARANLDAAREEERKVRLAVQLEVEHARLHLQEASERLVVTETAIAHARESVELVRARFEQGWALSPQLIDAETALTVARVRRAEAAADQRIAIARLRKALGLPQVDATP